MGLLFQESKAHGPDYGPGYGCRFGGGGAVRSAQRAGAAALAYVGGVAAVSRLGCSAAVFAGSFGCGQSGSDEPGPTATAVDRTAHRPAVWSSAYPNSDINGDNLFYGLFYHHYVSPLPFGVGLGGVPRTACHCSVLLCLGTG